MHGLLCNRKNGVACAGVGDYRCGMRLHHRRHLVALILAFAAPALAQQPYVFETTIAGVAEPMEVGFDSQGRLLIAAGREGLIRIEPDGSRTSLAPGRVDRVTRDSTVVADRVHHHVAVQRGATQNLVTGAAWPCGRLLAPEAAAVDPSGVLWIADTGNARVIRVDQDDIRVCGERGFFPGQFVAPSGIAFDSGGPLITDRLNHRVTRLDWQGGFRDIFGFHAVRPREGEGRIHYPTSIAMESASGRIAIAEPFERRVQIFRPRGAAEPIQPAPPMPSKDGVNSHFGEDLSVGGDVVAAWEPESGCVVVWDSRNNPPAHVATFGGTGDRPGVFRQPVSVLCESDGSAVWVLDELGDRLERWELRRDPKAPVQFDSFMARLSEGIPLRVARNEAGIPEVAGCDLVQDGQRIGVAFVDGSVAWTTQSLGTFQRDARAARPRNGSDPLRAASVDAQGRLLLLWNNGIERRDSGQALFVPLTMVAVDPRGAVAAGDHFIVSDAAKDSLLRVNAQGEEMSAVVAPREQSQRFNGLEAVKDGELWLPGRLAGGGTGPIWISDYGNHRLQRFGADGAWQATFTLSKSRAKDKSPPSLAPSAEDIAREQSLRQRNRDLALEGSGSLPLLSGGQLKWTTGGAIPRGEPFAMQVTAVDAAGAPLQNVSLLVDCTMPHHGHGMNVQPVITPTSTGCWKVEPMLLHMPGRWELAFDLAWPDGRIRRSQCSLEIE